jgi:hypothetical protein
MRGRLSRRACDASSHAPTGNQILPFIRSRTFSGRLQVQRRLAQRLGHAPATTKVALPPQKPPVINNRAHHREFSLPSFQSAMRGRLTSPAARSARRTRAEPLVSRGGLGEVGPGKNQWIARDAEPKLTTRSCVSCGGVRLPLTTQGFPLWMTHGAFPNMGETPWARR